jgi:hypothetical protein
MCHYTVRTTAAEERRTQETKAQNAVRQERAKRVEELLGNAIKPAEHRLPAAPPVRRERSHGSPVY